MAGEQAGEGVRPQCDDLLRQAREQLSVLMEEISVDALSVPASKGERASISNRSTIGVMLSGCKVETCLIGAPAWAASMQCGDIIEQVDGTAVSSATVQGALKGSDEPGSAVKLTVRRKSGESILLVLHRMASEQVADKRRLFELFTAIKDAASKRNDTATSNNVAESIDVWTRMLLEDFEHDTTIERNVEQLQIKCQGAAKKLACTLQLLDDLKCCSQEQATVGVGDLAQRVTELEQQNADLNLELEQHKACPVALETEKMLRAAAEQKLMESEEQNTDLKSEGRLRRQQNADMKLELETERMLRAAAEQKLAEAEEARHHALDTIRALRRQLEELESKQAPPPEVQETPRDVRQCLYTGCPPPLPLCGVGIIVAVYDDIDLNSGSVFIEKILPGGAADESGLVDVDDELLSINDVAPLDLQHVHSLITGFQGSSVTLELKRNGKTITARLFRKPLPPRPRPTPATVSPKIDVSETSEWNLIKPVETWVRSVRDSARIYWKESSIHEKVSPTALFGP